MKKVIIPAFVLFLSACSSTDSQVAAAEPELSDEEFVEQCLEEARSRQSCIAALVKKRLGYECAVPRKKALHTRIKRENCTTAASREKVAKFSEKYVDELIQKRKYIHLPKQG